MTINRRSFLRSAASTIAFAAVASTGALATLRSKRYLMGIDLASGTDRTAYYHYPTGGVDRVFKLAAHRELTIEEVYGVCEKFLPGTSLHPGSKFEWAMQTPWRRQMFANELTDFLNRRAWVNFYAEGDGTTVMTRQATQEGFRLRYYPGPGGKLDMAYTEMARNLTRIHARVLQLAAERYPSGHVHELSPFVVSVEADLARRNIGFTIDYNFYADTGQA